ncbi:MAG: helix-turn-helix transcriptional regulator [Kiritimatiellae bacterium]|nr:helix-turn-helix transcriptional regulator [Kiritimatiellia bacterium]
MGMRMKTELLRQAAKEKKISYRNLAKKTGLCLSTISAVFRGVSCTEETANRIACGLGVTLESVSEE